MPTGLNRCIVRCPTPCVPVSRKQRRRCYRTFAQSSGETLEQLPFEPKSSCAGRGHWRRLHVCRTRRYLPLCMSSIIAAINEATIRAELIAPTPRRRISESVVPRPGFGKRDDTWLFFECISRKTRQLMLLTQPFIGPYYSIPDDYQATLASQTARVIRQFFGGAKRANIN